jgi:hypothetical protein
MLLLGIVETYIAVVAASVVVGNDVAVAAAFIVAFDYPVLGVIDTYIAVVAAAASVVGSDVALVVAFLNAVAAAFNIGFTHAC